MKDKYFATIAHNIEQMNHTTLLFLISAVIWLGIVGLLIALLRKLGKLEKMINEKK